LQLQVVAREDVTAERTRPINALTGPLRTLDFGVDGSAQSRSVG
jgi:hypothetical protein